ncbi:YqgE/AlgH family protein [Candidatus Clavichlamydia salmonicola]|uniref:YqgE/AlgH family protein n=1 Tax=Candidatus Clavichlamydia salmonicola TaxID=469812 RepID=UPI0018914046|nr:YqgE/AlgH family protein [Candidatus Clavichlamydia salmonicola]
MVSRAPYSALERGTLLVASPDQTKGIFSRSVILICDHGVSGSFGLIINKHLDLEVPEEIFSQEKVINQHVGFRSGGPLQTTQMMILHSGESAAADAMQICPQVHLGGDLAFLSRMMMNPEGPHILLCFGYVGWQEGKLEQEFLDGIWYPYQSSSDYVFYRDPSKLWGDILKNMGGRYASLATVPSDISLN